MRSRTAIDSSSDRWVVTHQPSVNQPRTMIIPVTPHIQSRSTIPSLPIARLTEPRNDPDGHVFSNSILCMYSYSENFLISYRRAFEGGILVAHQGLDLATKTLMHRPAIFGNRCELYSTEAPISCIAAEDNEAPSCSAAKRTHRILRIAISRLLIRLTLNPNPSRCLIETTITFGY